MEMIRWLLGNRIVQVAWGLGILAVLLAWIFGGSKAGHETAEVEAPAKVEQVAQTVVATTDTATAVVTEAKEEVTEVAAEAAVAAGATTVVATAVATTQAIADTTEATTETVTETVAAVVKTETTGVVADAEQVVSSAEEAEVTEVATQTEEVVAEVAGEEVATVASEEIEVTTSADGLAEKSSEDLLMMAREAYWNNGLEEAAEIYTALIEREPNVIEHKGELGNVFWRQGFPKKAAELYADIAEPMIEKGNGERVSNMVGFIGLFFPERAANIRQLLEK